MGTPKTKEHHWTQPSRYTGRSHEMVRDQVRRNPVESREEGEARRLPVQEEGIEVKAAVVFTSSSFASSSLARFTTADGPKLSFSDVFRLVLTIVITTTKTKLSLFCFPVLSRSDKLSVSLSLRFPPLFLIIFQVSNNIFDITYDRKLNFVSAE